MIVYILYNITLLMYASFKNTSLAHFVFYVLFRIFSPLNLTVITIVFEFKSTIYYLFSI